MKKIVLICLALVLALGSLGVAYAMWSDTLVFSGPVTTGSVNLSFDDREPPVPTEYHINPDDPGGMLLLGEFEGKNVGETTASYTDYEVRGDKDGYEKLVITVSNAYPGYIVGTTFILHNIGTVPINVTEYVVTGEKQELDGTPICPLVFIHTLYEGYLFEDYDGDGVQDEGEMEVINLTITNALPFQLEACNSDKREIDLHFKQPLQQAKKYVFTVAINAEQWAE